MQQRHDYPSDITEQQWQRINTILPADKDRGRGRSTDLREVINGISYRWKTGCTWRMLPHDFPPWPTIYTYFQRWQRDGTLTQIRETLLKRQPRQYHAPRLNPMQRQSRSRNTTADSFS